MPESFNPTQALASESERLSTPKTAVVVGATTGMGAATALAFAGVGCERIVVVGRNERRAEEVMAACRARGAGEVVFVKADLS